MKHLLSSLLILFLSLSAISQTVVYTEDFEGSTYQVSNTGTGTSSWDINTRLHNGGLKCDSATLATISDNPVLQTTSFSTLGNYYVILEFAHICHLDFFDGGIIEISVDNGATWTQLTASQYTGSGFFTATTNQFNSNSYPPLWHPSSSTYVPDNTWWQDESFDISNIAANQANVLIRFAINDNQNNGSSGFKGWYIDDIEVTIAFSELIPPIINNLSDNLIYTVNSIGPYIITAEIIDQSGIDTAIVHYTINSVPQQSVGMSVVNGDTLCGIIPMVNDGDTICYNIFARDASPNLNVNTEPLNGCNQFIAETGLRIPYYDDFDVVDSLWWHNQPISTNTTIWEVGTSNLITPFSNPNVWGTNLNSFYNTYSVEYLYTPIFDFSQAIDAKLNFQYFCDTKLNRGGVRIEYTLDSIIWQTLGIYNDTNAIAWYNSNNLNYSYVPGWSGQSNAWTNSEYPLNFLNNFVGPVQFRFVFTSRNYSNFKGFYIDDFSITTPTDYDLKLIGLSKPINKTYYGNNETIEIEIKNQGIKTINFQNNPLLINVSNSGINPTVFSTLTVNSDSLAQNDTMLVAITNNYDMSLSGIYNFDANISCAVDTNAFNDSIISIQYTNHAIQNYPYIEDFESFSFGRFSDYIGWTEDYISQSPYFNIRWEIDSGYNSNLYTGPNHDHTIDSVNGNYMLFNSYFGTSTDTSLLISPYIILPNNIDNSYRLSYWYHMFGNQMGSLSLDILHNGIWLEDIIVISGEQQQFANEDWKIASYYLDAFEGDTIQIRFKCVKGTGSHSNMAIDDIIIEEIVPIDIKAINVCRTSQSTCFSNSETIEAQITNNGYDTVLFSSNNMIINCISTSLNPTTFTPISVVSDTLFPGDTMNIIINNNYDMSLSGSYFFNLYVSSIGDTVYSNDTLVNSLIYNSANVTYPYIIDFENTSWLSQYCLTPPPYWENSATTNGQFNWKADNSNSYHSMTGPRIDHTYGTSSGMYFCTDFSGSLGDSTYLTSPCINLDSLISPKLQFWYYMFGSDMGSLHFDIYNNGNWTKDVVVLNGEQQSYWTEPWKDINLNLFAYTNSLIKIRFRAYRGNGYLSQIVIDDIKIYEPIPQDAGVVKIIEPLDLSIGNTYSDITVVVQNHGSDTIYNYDVFATHNGSLPYTQSYNCILAPSELDTVSMNGFNVISGINEICAYTYLLGDINYYNDTLCKNYFGLPPVKLYHNDFESQNTPLQIEAGSKWEWGTPNGHVINYAYSGTKSWMIDLDSAYIPNLYDSIEIPRIFNFAYIHGAALSIAHWEQSTERYDGGKIEYSTNFGVSWELLGYINDPLAFNWYNENYYYGGSGWTGTNADWEYSIYDLSSFDYTNEPLQFRVVFQSDSINDNLDGFAFDNFSINVPRDSFDIGIIEFVNPISAGSVPGTQQAVTIKIKNFGLNTIYSSLVRYIDNLGFITTETWNGVLYPDSTVDYTFNSTYLSPNNAHQLTALTFNFADHYMFNDSIIQDIQVGIRNNDIGITNIIKPNIINNTSEVLNVIVEVTNFGLNSASNFDICYKAGNLPIVCETYNGTLLAGQSINYSFTQTFIAPTNSFNFCAETNLTNDIVSSNNEYCNMLSVGINENAIGNFTIGNCMPNPVLNNASIPIEIEHSGIIKFDIYNNLGQIIYTNQYSFDAGENQIEFNTGNLASGVYSYGISYKGESKYGKFCKN